MPTEVLKQRMQTTQKTFSGTLSHTLKDKGIAGLYRGFLMTLFRDVRKIILILIQSYSFDNQI